MRHNLTAGCDSTPSSPHTTDQTQRPALLTLYDRLPYEAAWNLQQARHADRVADRCPDMLLLMEHPPVYTAGRTTGDGHWPGADALTQQTGIPVLRSERGGSITYHGPDQLVGYPILRLTDHCAGPKAYVHRLEAVLIATLAEWGLAAHRRDRLPGVWVGGEAPAKIASIGVHLARGVTRHGFALNVAPDLRPFTHIVPCGIAACAVTSMALLLGTAPDFQLVRERLAAHFAEQFGLTWTRTIVPTPSTPTE